MYDPIKPIHILWVLKNNLNKIFKPLNTLAILINFLTFKITNCTT